MGKRFPRDKPHIQRSLVPRGWIIDFPYNEWGSIVAPTIQMLKPVSLDRDDNEREHERAQRLGDERGVGDDEVKAHGAADARQL